MLLRTRLRISGAISIGSILVIGSVLAWAVRDSRRASDAEDLANGLHQLILERGIMRDEFLLYRETRARVQWDTATDRLVAQLRRSRTVFEGAESRHAIDEMLRLTEKGKGLFEDLVRLPDVRETAPGPPSVSTALRERIASKLILLSYELDGNSSRLEALAAGRSRTTQYRTMVLVFILIGTSLTVFAANSVLATRLVERRIGRLQVGAERIAAGDFAHRIGFEGDDELAALGRSFDEMAARLEQTVLGLASSNRELEAFSYSVSHDLRAPLRAVDGFSRIVLEDHAEQLDAEGKRLLGVVRSNTRQMGQLIDDLLSFSRVGRQAMARTAVDMRALADEAFRGLDAADRKVSFTVGDLPGADVDPPLMRQVWVNFVSNALKFTRPKAEPVIEIAGRTEPGRVVYSVKDNGVGFDMAYRDKLFGVFQRLHSSHEFEGTGVGLALVQRIVHRHGGEVWAEGKVGEGATFSFSLPAGGSP